MLNPFVDEIDWNEKHVGGHASAAEAEASEYTESISSPSFSDWNFLTRWKMMCVDIGLKHMVCGYTEDMKTFNIFTFDIYKENI